MIVKTWGTRGSTPVAGPDKVKYGGNTTCVEISSRCLPDNMSLCVDGGTGMVPYGKEVMRGIRVMKEKKDLTSISHGVVCLLTHYHWDHIQGIPLSPLLYSKDVSLSFFGPDEAPDYTLTSSSARGPQLMLEALLKHPFFPVGYHAVASRIRTFHIASPQEEVILFHPTGGCTKILRDLFEAIDMGLLTVSFGPSKGSYPLKECLVVKMYKSNHPEYTISYRFEERPTGKVFVFLTDHEVTASFSSDLLNHVRGANLLIGDAQYLEDTYQKSTAGFGHGTGPYCYRLAKAGGVTTLGLTHHDPNASDQDIESVLSEALEESAPLILETKEPEGMNDTLKRLFPVTIFSCSDYQQISV